MERIEHSQLDRLLPHREPMRVVAGVEILDSDNWKVSLRGLPYEWLGLKEGEAVPGYWAVEWMAQAAALGSAVVTPREKTPEGRLVLIRNLRLNAFWLAITPAWIIQVERLQGEGTGLFLFRAQLENPGGTVEAEAEFGVWIEDN